jgi:hypothetical protein
MWNARTCIEAARHKQKQAHILKTETITISIKKIKNKISAPL